MDYVAVREMLESDLREIMRIEMVSFPDPWAPLAFVSDLRYNERASYRVLVSSEGRIVGYLGWWNMIDHVSVLKLAVDPTYRRRGLAGRLMKEAFRSCAEQGFDVVQLHVRASNVPAISLYQALGFQVAESLEGYYSNGEAALSMYCPAELFDTA